MDADAQLRPDDSDACDQREEMMNHFTELAAIDVGKHIEKKGQLSYLSWAWAVDQLLRRDPTAQWSYAEPTRFGDTMMVACTVTAFGIARTMQLPVMDHRNKAIANPDAFAVNTAMQRCLVKAIALHGLGLYIYAGEDLPLDDSAPEAPRRMPESELADWIISIDSMADRDELKAMWKKASAAAKEYGDERASKAFTDAASKRAATFKEAA